MFSKMIWNVIRKYEISWSRDHCQCLPCGHLLNRNGVRFFYLRLADLFIVCLDSIRLFEIRVIFLFLHFSSVEYFECILTIKSCPVPSRFSYAVTLGALTLSLSCSASCIEFSGSPAAERKSHLAHAMWRARALKSNLTSIWVWLCVCV